MGEKMREAGLMEEGQMEAGLSTEKVKKTIHRKDYMMKVSKCRRAFLKYSPLLRFLTVAVLFFLGNRIFNHVSAWGGIVLISLGAILAVYFTIKPININENNEEN